MAKAPIRPNAAFGIKSGYSSGRQAGIRPRTPNAAMQHQGEIGSFERAKKAFLNEKGRSFGITPKTLEIMINAFKKSEAMRERLAKERANPEHQMTHEIRAIIEVLRDVEHINLPDIRLRAFANWVYNAQKHLDF